MMIATNECALFVWDKIWKFKLADGGGVRGVIVIINIHDQCIIYVIYNYIATYVFAFSF